MPQFEKVSSKVDGNAAKKVNESSNDPLPHGLERDVKPWLHAVEMSSCEPILLTEPGTSRIQSHIERD